MWQRRLGAPGLPHICPDMGDMGWVRGVSVSLDVWASYEQIGWVTIVVRAVTGQTAQTLRNDMRASVVDALRESLNAIPQIAPKNQDYSVKKFFATQCCAANAHGRTESLKSR